MARKLPVQFSASAPKDKTRPHIDLVRCPPTSTRPYLVTADNVVGCEVYWMAGRSNPHLAASPEQIANGETVECPGCDAGKHHRFVAWLTCWDEQKLQHIILEVSANASEQIGTYRHQYGTLRGARIVLSRKNQRYNGTMTATLSQSALHLEAIPAAFDLIEQLEFLWQCPNKSDKAVMVTPREIPAKEPRRKHDSAETAKVYTASPEQLEMLAANKTAAQTRLTEAQLDAAAKAGETTRKDKSGRTTTIKSSEEKAAAADFQKQIAETKKNIKQTNGHKTR